MFGDALSVAAGYYSWSSTKWNTQNEKGNKTCQTFSNFTQLVIFGVALIGTTNMILIQLCFLHVRKGNYCWPFEASFWKPWHPSIPGTFCSRSEVFHQTNLALTLRRLFQPFIFSGALSFFSGLSIADPLPEIFFEKACDLFSSFHYWPDSSVSFYFQCIS